MKAISSFVTGCLMKDKSPEVGDAVRHFIGADGALSVRRDDEVVVVAVLRAGTGNGALNSGAGEAES